MNTWRFLPLCWDDLDAVAQIETLSFEHPWNRPAFLEGLAHPNVQGFVLLVEAGDAQHQVGAYVFQRILRDDVHIMKLAVAPPRRRQGLAAYLTAQALDAAGGEGCRRAILEVRVSNWAAIGLYTHLGFETIGKRKRYYGPSGEDALVMAKNIEEAS